MKVRFLDEWGSKIEISGEINSSFTIGQNKTVTFAKNATFLVCIKTLVFKFMK